MGGQHHRPLDLSAHSRRRQLDRVYARDKGICQGCNTWIPRNQATREHVVDLSDGGSTADENVVLHCDPCNQRKATEKRLRELAAGTRPAVPWWEKRNQRRSDA